MDTEEFIQQQLKLIREGFDLFRIRGEVWLFVYKDTIGRLPLDTIILRAMEVYGEVIKRSHADNPSCLDKPLNRMGKIERLVTGNPADLDEL